MPVSPSRGLILDRNGVILARNQPGFSLEIRPEAPDLEALIDDLAALVDITARDRARFRRLLAEAPEAESLPIRSRLTEEEAARFAANRYRFLGAADIRALFFRDYPSAETASHVVGYVGRISDADLAGLAQAGLEAAYRGTEVIGKSGVEAAYEAELHGVAGFEQVEIDAAGRRVRTLSSTPPRAGSNVSLTLDQGLQAVAERALGTRRGAAAALAPFSGAVLALVSTPGYDPNLFVDGIDPESWAALNTSPDRPLLNRAIAGIYPPGSTFKPFMALAALALGKRTPRSTILDTGTFEFGGRRYRTASKRGGHGRVDLYRSIVVSSDVYYYQLAHDLGIEAIARFMAPLGFGAPTGIEIPGEAAGILPSPEWKRTRFRRAEQQRWYPGETISVGIGQGYNSYTPLQLAHALASVLNGGSVHQPRLLSHVYDRRTGERTHAEPELVRHAPLDPAHVAFVKTAMAGVNREGTGAAVFADAEYTSGGKTGTAQVIGIRQNESYDERNVAERHRDHSWFIAFAPVEAPKIALAVIVENGGFGSRAAAPVARAMLDYYLLGTE